MLYRQIIRGGALADTAVKKAYDEAMGRADQALERVRDDYARARLPYLTLPEMRDDLHEMRRVADHICSMARDVVVLGTGGSSLGAQALLALQGIKVDRDPEATKVHFPDNLAAHTMDTLLRELDLKRTHFIVISKSGGTAETLAQMMASFSAMRLELDAEEISRHFTLVTEPGDNLLRRFAQRWDLPVLDHDPRLGGRYSVMSLVGLLPAMIAGLDVVSVRQGAQQVLRHALAAPSLEDIPAVVGAVTGFALLSAHQSDVQVMMPYDSRLEAFAGWWKQLWAESLGKDGRGTTPVFALGPVDQHSQLQLYLDGPDDKFYTLVTLDTQGAGPAIDSSLATDPKLDYLSGRTIGDLVTAEAQATIEALVARGRPLRNISLRVLNERAIGALLMHYMLETVISAHLMDVDPFDQPAVEDGKKLTREAMRANQIRVDITDDAITDLKV